MGRLTDFYSGRETDDAGRYISDVMSMNDEEMEVVHDYVQWLYPNREPSMICRDAPVLNDEDIEVFKKEHKKKAQKAVDKFTAFLRKNGQWRRPFDHNHLRVTRILKFCREVGVSSTELFMLVMGEPSISWKSKSYWFDATSFVMRKV